MIISTDLLLKKCVFTQNNINTKITGVRKICIYKISKFSQSIELKKRVNIILILKKTRNN